MNEILEMLQELRPEFDFSSSDNFIEDELLDSFDVIALVDMFEKEFHIKIDALDILPENFTNINTMKDLINKNEENEMKNTNSISFLSSHVRNPLPKKVIWDITKSGISQVKENEIILPYKKTSTL